MELVQTVFIVNESKSQRFRRGASWQITLNAYWRKTSVQKSSWWTNKRNWFEISMYHEHAWKRCSQDQTLLEHYLSGPSYHHNRRRPTRMHHFFCTYNESHIDLSLQVTPKDTATTALVHPALNRANEQPKTDRRDTGYRKSSYGHHQYALTAATERTNTVNTGECTHWHRIVPMATRIVGWLKKSWQNEKEEKQENFDNGQSQKKSERKFMKCTWIWVSYDCKEEEGSAYIPA